MNNTSLSDIIKLNNPKNKLQYSLKEYYSITREHIIKYLNNEILKTFKINPSYIQYILNNDDVFTDLTTALMMADWTHDITKSSLRYWRTKCLIYHISKILKKNKVKSQSLPSNTVYNILPEQEYFHKEKFEVTTQSLECLNDRQKKIIKYKFYRNFSEARIAKRLNISQPRIQQLMCDIKYKLAPKLEQLL